MGSDKFTFEADVLPVVQAWASRSLSSDPDRDAKVNDAASIAWEIFMTSPDDATPSTIARYAVKRVRSERTFRESIRSVSSPKRRLGKPERCTFDVQTLWRIGDNPARVVGFKIDYHAWLDGLRPKARRIAELLASGHTTQQVAGDCRPVGTLGRQSSRPRKRGRLSFFYSRQTKSCALTRYVNVAGASPTMPPRTIQFNPRRSMMSQQAKETLQEALESGPVERIEIELLPNQQFRWKLWSGGRMTYCANGQGVASEIAAMIQSTDVIARTMLGVGRDD